MISRRRSSRRALPIARHEALARPQPVRHVPSPESGRAQVRRSPHGTPGRAAARVARVRARLGRDRCVRPRSARSRPRSGDARRFRAFRPQEARPRPRGSGDTACGTRRAPCRRPRFLRSLPRRPGRRRAGHRERIAPPPLGRAGRARR